MNLKDQVILVTGAAYGLGEATAKLLAEAGAKVALLDIAFERIEKLAAQLSGLAVHVDVSDAHSGLAAIEKIVNYFGKINGCVNCAGVASAARIVGRNGPHDLTAFTRTIQINLVGTFNMMRLSAEQMLKQYPVNEDGERGVIINTASVAAYEGQIGQAAYSASKGGVVAMTLPAAREFGQHGIRVMTIAPGIFNTPMMGAMPETVKHSLAENVVFPKRLGLPEEYAKLVQTIFENSYLNGSVIRLDGAIRMAEK